MKRALFFTLLALSAFCIGAGNSTGISGGGISSLNGLRQPIQTLAIGSSGTAPAFSSSGGAHTLNIPLASASGVTRGTVAKSEYDAWQAKYDANTAQFAPPVAASAAAGQYCAVGDLTTCFYITSTTVGIANAGTSVQTVTKATGKTRFKIGGTASSTGTLTGLGVFSAVNGANNSGTGETDLSPWTLSADTLSATGESAVLEQSGTFAASSSSVKRVRVYFAGTLIFDSNTTSTASTAADAYRVRAEVVRTNTTTARANVTFMVSKPAASPGTGYTYQQSTGLTSQDFTTTNIFKVTGQAGASNEIQSNHTRGYVNNI